MKRTAIVVLAALSLMPGWQARAAGREHRKKDIQTLNESVDALKKSNPALAERLKQYASREANERVETAGVSVESDKQDIELLRECASELKVKHPVLSRRLNKFADKEAKEMREPMREAPAKKTSPSSPSTPSQQMPPTPGY